MVSREWYIGLVLQNDKEKTKGKPTSPSSDPYEPTKSQEDITREKDEEALQAVIASLDETKAAEAKLQQREQETKNEVQKNCKYGKAMVWSGKGTKRLWLTISF